MLNSSENFKFLYGEFEEERYFNPNIFNKDICENFNSMKNIFREKSTEPDEIQNKKPKKLLEENEISNQPEIFIKNGHFDYISENRESNNSFISNITKTKKKHTKYNDDNMIRKIKHIILISLLDFINSKIRELYNNNIGKGILIKQLQTLNQKQKTESNVEFNKNFLNKTIGEIFSNEITKRKSTLFPDHNKIIIQGLLNEKDEFKKNYFNTLFNLTFLESLEHFRGTKFVPVLQGMNSLDNEIKNYIDEDYIALLNRYSKDYAKIIRKKKSRKKRTVNQKKKLI